MNQLPREVWIAARTRLQAQLEKTQRLLAEVDALLAQPKKRGRPPKNQAVGFRDPKLLTASVHVLPKKRVFISAATRRKMAASQKRRWQAAKKVVA